MSKNNKNFLFNDESALFNSSLKYDFYLFIHINTVVSNSNPLSKKFTHIEIAKCNDLQNDNNYISNVIIDGKNFTISNKTIDDIELLTKKYLPDLIKCSTKRTKKYIVGNQIAGANNSTFIKIGELYLNLSKPLRDEIVKDFQNNIIENLKC